MWHRVLAFSFIVTLTSAWADSCYSVALWTLPAEQYHPQNSKGSVEDTTCKVLRIGASMTERCGCYDDMDKAELAIEQLLKRYPRAYITTTERGLLPKAEDKGDALKGIQTKVRRPVEFPMVRDADVKEQKQTQLLEALKKNSQSRDAEIEAQSDLKGLYLGGKYGQYFDEDYFMRDYTDFEYDVNLRFEFFKNGYFEHKKEKQTSARASRLSYLQGLSVLQKNRFADTQLMIEALRSEITLHYYQQLSALYYDAIVKKKEELQKSLTTRYELTRLLQMRHRFTHSAKIYEQRDRSAVDIRLYKMLQEIEYLGLVDLERIKEHAKRYNADIMIEDSKMHLLDVSKSYSDDIKMSLYVNRRAVDELGWYHTVGAQAELPLDFSSAERQRLATLQKDAFAIERSSFEATLEHKLDSLYRTFKELQEFIEIDKDEVSFLNIQIKEFKSVKENAIAKLDFDPDEKILASKKETLDVKFDLLMRRADLLETLTEIAFVSNIPDIEHLIREE